MQTAASETINTARPPVKKTARFRRLRIALGLFLIAVLAVNYPPFFQIALRRAALFYAWRNNIDLKLEVVAGSLFEPITLQNVSVHSTSQMGTTTKAQVGRIDAFFSLKNFLLRRSGIFTRLIIDTADCEVRYGGAPPVNRPITPVSERKESSAIETWLPAQIDFRRANLLIGRNEETFRFQNIRLTAGESGPGLITVRRLDINQPWLKKSLTNLSGGTTLKGSEIAVTKFRLEEGISVESFETDLGTKQFGNEMTFKIAAFGGSIDGEAKIQGHLNGHLNFESIGSCKNISVSDFARFIDAPDPAGGIVNEGQFTFHGSPRDLALATLTTRFNATDFQWGDRRWTSLDGGAMLIHRRIEIPDLRLKQAHNELTLHGEMAVPSRTEKWWQTEFAFDVAAKIDNLTELSALLGPKFSNMSGQGSIDGSVRGKNQSFSGQLVVSGSQIYYQSAPLDSLRASIKLEGNEMHITNLEFVHKDDFLRGQGVVNILGETAYSGTARISAADVSVYYALLQPFAPWCDGGIVLDWSGSCAANLPTGAFHAQLKNFRTISAPHQVDADVEAAYLPDKISFTKFNLNDQDSSFSAKIEATPKALNVSEIHLEQDTQLALDGEIVVPIDVWRASRESPAKALDFSGLCKGHLAAKKLDLHRALLLTGRQFPLKAMIDGEVDLDGSFTDPKVIGALRVTGAQFQLNENSESLTDLSAAVTFTDQDMFCEKSNVRFHGLDFGVTGQVNFKDINKPNLKLSVHGSKIPLQPIPEIEISSDVNLVIEGPIDAAQVSGTAAVQRAEWNNALDLTSLIASSPVSARLSPIFIQPPFANWALDLECGSSAPLKLHRLGGSVTPHLHVTGTFSAPLLTGSISVAGIPVYSPYAEFTLDSGEIQFPAHTSHEPIFDLRGSGKVGGTKYSGYIFGLMSQTQFIVVSDSEVESATLFDWIMHGRKITSPFDSLSPAISDEPEESNE